MTTKRSLQDENLRPQKPSVIVVGGGPAGMMAAVRAAQLGASVTLIERNATLGRKLLLTGKGRCNLTNAADLDAFLGSYGAHGPFLRDVFKKFFNAELMRFFEDRGVALKVERQARVFPVSDRSGSILEALKKELQACRVQISSRSEARDIVVDHKAVAGVVLATGQRLNSCHVVWATGGKSYPLTGSTGEGILLAARWGHRIVPLRPALVGLETRQTFPGDMRGLTLKNVRLRFSNGKHQIVSDIGEVLFTDFGISGPLVLTHSGQVVDWLNVPQRVTVSLDLKPSLTEEILSRRLSKDVRESRHRKVKNALKDYFPTRFVDVFLRQGGVSPDKALCQLNLPEQRALVRLFKDFILDIKGARSFKEAMVTQGGVDLKDVNPRTMESRVVRGLFFAGEMLDIDGTTGGFNLQAAFSTGYVAGESAAMRR
ncbi:MAG: NAD(P)/FAD-dependent oxidoreductase [Candidatus Omnitrophota bacterium]|jgi:hypothetical protein